MHYRIKTVHFIMRQIAFSQVEIFSRENFIIVDYLFQIKKT